MEEKIHDYTKLETRIDTRVMIRYYSREYDKVTGAELPGLKKYLEIRYSSDWFIDYYVRNNTEYKYLLITKIN